MSTLIDTISEKLIILSLLNVYFLVLIRSLVSMHHTENLNKSLLIGLNLIRQSATYNYSHINSTLD